jgi:hypothetical protein
MTQLRFALIAIALAAPRAAAQTAASTLAALAERAGIVVVARVLHVDERGEAGRRVVFATLERLRGDAGERFALEEPGATGCGRALAGLAPGAGYLLFLRRDGERILPLVLDSRAIVRLEPALRTHVAALLGAADERQRCELLAAALSSPSARVRRDAIEALSRHRGAASIGTTARRLVAAAFDERLDAPELDVRLAAAALDLPHPGLRAALRTSLARCSTERIARACRDAGLATRPLARRRELGGALRESLTDDLRAALALDDHRVQAPTPFRAVDPFRR